MIERLKGTFTMNLVGWLCLPALILSFILSIPPVAVLTALANQTDIQGSIRETIHRDLSMIALPESASVAPARRDPFDIAESYSRWLPERMLRDRQVICLAKNIWYESRGEPSDGQLAVGLVTLNRAEHTSWPKTICEVVYQPGQFSWTAEPSLRNKKPTGEQWEQIVLLSATLMHRKDLFDDITDGATYFHAAYIKPGWSKLQHHTVRLGQHVFYKPKEQQN